MRSTHTKPTDYDKMIKHVKSYIGKPTVIAIDAFAAKRKIVGHRAAKVFWNLVDDGQIICKQHNGLEIIQEVNEILGGEE